MPRKIILIAIVLVAVLLVGGGAFALWYVPAPGWRTNDITTGAAKGYPNLVPRSYDFPPEQTVVFAAAAASRIPRWRVVRTDRAAGVVQVEVKTPVLGFTDDLTVTVERTGERGDSSRVLIRSRSRIGRSDLGENARHIRALQKVMDSKLPQL